jgi:hypothetical protein
VILVAGCTPRDMGPTKPDRKDEEKEVEPEAGFTRYAEPNHKYHADLKIDKEAKQATIHLLDKRGKDPVPTKAESFTLTIKDAKLVQVTLKPQRRDSDPKDAASRFVGNDDRLAEAIDLDKIEISGSVDGKPFVFKPDKD